MNWSDGNNTKGATGERTGQLGGCNARGHRFITDGGTKSLGEKLDVHTRVS